MAVTAARRLHTGRKGTVDEVHNRSYTAVWLVRTNNAFDDAIVVGSAQAFGLPFIGDPYTDGQGNSDVAARCRSINPEPYQDDKFTWVVTCEFSSARPSGTGHDPADRSENPTERPAEISWDFEHYRKPLARAFIVNEVGEPSLIPFPVLNSAGFPFDPPIEDDEYRLVFKINKNVVAYDPLVALDYMGAVNSDEFEIPISTGLTQTFAPGQCKIRKFTGNLTFEHAVNFFRQDVEIEIKVEGWDIPVLDAGFVALELITGAGFEQPVQQTDEYGQPLNDPVLLDGQGFKLAEGADPVYITLRPRERLAFTPLNLFG